MTLEPDPPTPDLGTVTTRALLDELHTRLRRAPDLDPRVRDRVVARVTLLGAVLPAAALDYRTADRYPRSPGPAVTATPAHSTGGE